MSTSQLRVDALLRLLNAPTPLHKLAAAVITEDRPGPDETVFEEDSGYDPEDDRVVADVEPPPAPARRINLLQHPDSHPVVLDVMLLRDYGPEWLEWDFETLLYRLRKDYNTPNVSDVTKDKLQGIKAIHMVDSFWQDWDVFSHITLAFNSVPVDFSVAPQITLKQASVAVDMAKRMRGEVPWSEEMLAFLHQLHIFDGYAVSIPPLEFITVDAEAYPVDEEEVKRRWPEVKAARKVEPKLTPENVQLSLLLELYEELEASRELLAEQLPMLYHASDGNSLH